MAEEKTEKPTPQKLKEAKKQGQIAKSQDLIMLASTLFCVGLAFVFYSDISAQIAQQFTDLLLLSSTVHFSPQGLIDLFIQSFAAIAFVIVPVLALYALFSVLITVGHTGGVFSLELIKPNFSKINPAQGFKKLFSKRVLFELFKNLLKLGLFAGLVYGSKDYLFAQAIRLYEVPADQQGEIWASTIMKLILIFGLLYIPVALLDLAFSRYDFLNKMKMSKTEVKDEAKKREGDPEVKQKQKKTQKELLEKVSALSQVKDADVIVTNPTHIAIALKYEPRQMVSPQLIAMGKGAMAKKIRMLAHKYQIRVIQNKPLARQLYKEVQLGSYVPPKFYNQVVPIFRELLRVRSEQGSQA